MKYREKLGYIALGGVLMLVGMLAAGLFSPLGAQDGISEAKFGKITCTELVVKRSSVDQEGVVSIGSQEDGSPYVFISGAGGILYLSPRQVKGNTVYFDAYDQDFDQWYVRIGVSEEIGGGFVGVRSMDGKKGNSLYVK